MPVWNHVFATVFAGDDGPITIAEIIRSFEALANIVCIGDHAGEHRAEFGGLGSRHHQGRHPCSSLTRARMYPRKIA